MNELRAVAQTSSEWTVTVLDAELSRLALSQPERAPRVAAARKSLRHFCRACKITDLSTEFTDPRLAFLLQFSSFRDNLKNRKLEAVSACFNLALDGYSELAVRVARELRFSVSELTELLERCIRSGLTQCIRPVLRLLRVSCTLPQATKSDDVDSDAHVLTHEFQLDENDFFAEETRICQRAQWPGLEDVLRRAFLCADANGLSVTTILAMARDCMPLLSCDVAARSACQELSQDASSLAKLLYESPLRKGARARSFVDAISLRGWSQLSDLERLCAHVSVTMPEFICGAAQSLPTSLIPLLLESFKDSDEAEAVDKALDMRLLHVLLTQQKQQGKQQGKQQDGVVPLSPSVVLAMQRKFGSDAALFWKHLVQHVPGYSGAAKLAAVVAKRWRKPPVTLTENVLSPKLTCDENRLLFAACVQQELSPVAPDDAEIERRFARHYARAMLLHGHVARAKSVVSALTPAQWSALVCSVARDTVVAALTGPTTDTDTNDGQSDHQSDRSSGHPVEQLLREVRHMAPRQLAQNLAAAWRLAGLLRSLESARVESSPTEPRHTEPTRVTWAQCSDTWYPQVRVKASSVATVLTRALSPSHGLPTLQVIQTVGAILDTELAGLFVGTDGAFDSVHAQLQHVATQSGAGEAGAVAQAILQKLARAALARGERSTCAALLQRSGSPGFLGSLPSGSLPSGSLSSELDRSMDAAFEQHARRLQRLHKTVRPSADSVLSADSATSSGTIEGDAKLRELRRFLRHTALLDSDSASTLLSLLTDTALDTSDVGQRAECFHDALALCRVSQQVGVVGIEQVLRVAQREAEKDKQIAEALQSLLALPEAATAVETVCQKKRVENTVHSLRSALLVRADVRRLFFLSLCRVSPFEPVLELARLLSAPVRLLKCRRVLLAVLLDEAVPSDFELSVDDKRFLIRLLDSSVILACATGQVSEELHGVPTGVLDRFACNLSKWQALFAVCKHEDSRKKHAQSVETQVLKAHVAALAKLRHFLDQNGQNKMVNYARLCASPALFALTVHALVDEFSVFLWRRLAAVFGPIFRLRARGTEEELPESSEIIKPVLLHAQQQGIDELVVYGVFCAAEFSRIDNVTAEALREWYERVQMPLQSVLQSPRALSLSLLQSLVAHSVLADAACSVEERCQMLVILQSAVAEADGDMTVSMLSLLTQVSQLLGHVDRAQHVSKALTAALCRHAARWVLSQSRRVSVHELLRRVLTEALLHPDPVEIDQVLDRLQQHVCSDSLSMRELSSHVADMLCLQLREQGVTQAAVSPRGGVSPVNILTVLEHCLLRNTALDAATRRELLLRVLKEAARVGQSDLLQWTVSVDTSRTAETVSLLAQVATDGTVQQARVVTQTQVATRAACDTLRHFVPDIVLEDGLPEAVHFLSSELPRVRQHSSVEDTVRLCDALHTLLCSAFEAGTATVHLVSDLVCLALDLSRDRAEEVLDKLVVVREASVLLRRALGESVIVDRDAMAVDEENEEDAFSEFSDFSDWDNDELDDVHMSSGVSTGVATGVTTGVTTDVTTGVTTEASAAVTETLAGILQRTKLRRDLTVLQLGLRWQLPPALVLDVLALRVQRRADRRTRDRSLSGLASGLTSGGLTSSAFTSGGLSGGLTSTLASGLSGLSRGLKDITRMAQRSLRTAELPLFTDTDDTSGDTSDSSMLRQLLLADETVVLLLLTHALLSPAISLTQHAVLVTGVTEVLQRVQRRDDRLRPPALQSLECVLAQLTTRRNLQLGWALLHRMMRTSSDDVVRNFYEAELSTLARRGSEEGVTECMRVFTAMVAAPAAPPLPANLSPSSRGSRPRDQH
ncbi:MAG: hypothetical protein MHM6MM_000325 [Cercozoa sp. M6MM]